MKHFTTKLTSLCVFLAFIIMGAWSVGAQANTITLSGSALNNCSTKGAFTGTINHGTVTLKGVGKDSCGFKYKEYDFGSALRSTAETFDMTRYFELSWKANANCQIKVTKVTITAKMYNFWWWIDCVMNVNGSSSKIGTANLDDTDGTWTSVSSNVAEGVNKVQISMNRNDEQEHPLIIKSITLEYTVTPSAPTVTTSSASVDVTIDKANPQTIDLKNYFNYTDAHFYETTQYESTVQDGWTVENNLFYAEKAGVYPLTAYVAALQNCHNQSASSASAVTITVNRVNPTLTLAKSQDTLEATVDTQNPTYYDIESMVKEYVGDGLTYSVVSGNETAFLDGSKFYATATGEYTIRILSDQSDRYNSDFQDVVIDVKKATPFISTVFEETPSMMVGDSVQNAFNAKNTSDLTFNIVRNNIDAINNGQEDVITYDQTKNLLAAVNAGQATITFTQAETDVIRPAVFTYVITVNKYNNRFFFVMDGDSTNEATMLWDSEIAATVKTANTDLDFTVTPGEGVGTYASFTKNADLDAHQIISEQLNGTAKWYVSQEEDYKYTAAKDSFMVTVQQVESACNIYNMFDIVGENDMEPVSSLGEVAIPGYGAAGTLSFNARRSGIAVNTSMHVEEYVDGQWKQVGNDITDLDGSSKSYSRQLTPTATKFRFASNGGLLDKHVKWVTLSRVTYLKPAQDTVIIYDILRDTTVADSFQINYSTCDAFTIRAKADNAQLNIIDNKIATNENEAKTATVKMEYTSKADQAFGYDTINVRIYNASFDTNIVVLAEIVEKTRLQIAQEDALKKLDSIANELKGNNPDTIPSQELDSLNNLLDSLKKEILEDAKTPEEVKELLNQDEENLNNFLEEEKQKAKEQIEELVKDVDPISDELKELLKQSNDTIDNANQLDSLQMRLENALDTIQKQILKEQEQLRQAKDSAKQEIDEKVEEILGNEPLTLPEEWKNLVDSLQKQIKDEEIEKSKTVPQVNDTTDLGKQKLDELKELIREEVKDSVEKIIEGLKPMSEEMTELTDSLLKKIEDAKDLSELAKELEEGLKNIEEQEEKEKEELTLNDDPFDNTELLDDLLNQERDITINTIFAANEWTTICLPFGLNTLVGTPLENAQVVAMSNSTFADDSLFVNVRPVQVMTAGQPYLIRPSQDIINPKFVKVTIAASKGSYNEAGAVRFTGTLRPMDLQNDYDLTKGSSNVLDYVVDADTTVRVKAFRAYFTVNSFIYADFTPVRVVLDKESVGCEQVKVGKEADKYIEDGIFFIRRGEKIFNAQGQVVK